MYRIAPSVLSADFARVIDAMRTELATAGGPA